MIDYGRNWSVIDGWDYRYPNDKNKFPTEKGIKIFISVDPNDINKAKKIFKDFMDYYDLCGKMPPILDNKSLNNRNTLIIYSTLTEDMLLELEKKLQKKGVKPRLLKSGSRIPDIAIKNSLYFYFKCDNLKNYAYNNKKQVKLMDKIRNSNKYDNIKIIKYYKEIDFSNKIPINEYFKDYDEHDDYFKYLEIIKNCNAVQRQIIDAVFRNELFILNDTTDWYNFDFEFIKDKLKLVEVFIKNTKDIPESELRKFLNYFVIGGYIDEEPIMTKKGFNFIQKIKSILSISEENDIDSEFNKLYSEIDVNKQLPTVKIKKDFISEIKEYYGDADFFDLAYGNFALKHLNFIIDDFCNYHKEMGLDISEDLEEVKELLDIKVIEDGAKDFLEERYNSYYKNIIVPNLDKILNVIEKYKNIIAIRTAENEYNLFIEKYSSKLNDILTENLKKVIKECLYDLFSYDNTIEEKIEAKKTLQYNLYGIKKYYKFLNGTGKINKYKYFEDAKSFMMWNGIVKSGVGEKFLKNIDKYRRRYIKYNNIKYNNLEEGNLITTTIESPMIFARGMEISDKTANTFLKIGMDGEYIDYVTISDFNKIKNNTLHKGLVSVTTNAETANKYAGDSIESKIFLISVPKGTKVLNSIFSDHRAYEYSELDLISVPAEWIIGYFKVRKNKSEEKEYFFKKNPNFKNENLSKRFQLINNFNMPVILGNGLKYRDYDIEFILAKSDLKRKKMQNKCYSEMINMINDIIDFSKTKLDNNILLQKTLNLFKNKFIQNNLKRILNNIFNNYMLYLVDNNFNPDFIFVKDNKKHYVLAHIYNNYHKLKEEEKIELENIEKSRKVELDNIPNFDKKNECIAYIIKLYANISSILREEHKAYITISSIIMDGSLKILSDKNGEVKMSSDNIQNNNYGDNIYKKDIEYKKFIIKNSIELLKIIENEINDITNPQSKKRNSKEQSEKLKNIIADNLKNYDFNNYGAISYEKRDEIFLNITGAINYYEKEEEEECESYEIDI